MPRFFFDTDNGDTFSKDEEGLDLLGLEAARLQAQASLADMADAVVPSDGIETVVKVEVRDESVQTVVKGSIVLKIET
jgi:hypothetical protein